MPVLPDTLFRQAIDQAYGAVLITTANLDAPGPFIVYANAAFCEQTGYTEQELLGTSPRILQGPETDRALLSRLRNALAQEGGFDGQTVNYRKDGTPYRVRWSIRPIRDASQRITHYLSLQNAIADINVAHDEFTRQTKLLHMAEKTVRFGGWTADLQNHRIEWSNVVAEIHGMPRGYSPSFDQAVNYYLPEHRDQILQAFTACAEQGIAYDEELQIMAADGQRRWVRSLGQPIYDSSERIIGVSGACQDVTVRREREQEVRKLAYITEQSPAPITVTDLDGNIEYVNAAFEQLSGYSRDELIGKTSARIKSGHTPDTTYQNLWQTIQAGHVWTGDLQNRRKDGTLFWERELIAPLADDLGRTTHFVAIKQDITAMKAAEKELSRIAFEDTLTGLYSRSGFTHALTSHLESAGWQASGIVAIMDITGLRDINDAYGYDAGDQLLIELGRRLTQGVGEHKLTGRIGGDEFVFFLSLNSTEKLEARLHHLLNALTKPVMLEGAQIEISARLGYTCLGHPRRPVESLLREAERALFRHRVSLSTPWIAYDEQLQQDSRLRIQLTRELRHALDDDQFALHFQPKVDLATGELVACEALLRWHHPQHGLIPPGIFIPIAEQSQLIAPIGAWVLRNACQHLQAWRRSGLTPVSVAVNISLIQFQTGDLPHQVAHVLKETGVAPSELVLELTESVFSDASATLLQQMHALREMGVRLSLDDFGTGYSSLLYLQQYPVDEIKIDQGFIFQLLDDPFSRQLVKAVLMIADALHADVLAEGIETAEVGEALRAMGCRFGQGYYYSRPLNAEQFRCLLAMRGRLPADTGRYATLSL